MKIATPSAALAPYVRALEVVEAEDDVIRTLLPEPGLILGIRYGGAARLLNEGDQATLLPSSMVTGLRFTARRMHTSRGGGIVLVKFQPLGAAAFFDFPLHELCGTFHPLHEWVDPRVVEDVESRLADAKGHIARLAVVESLLMGLLRRPRPDQVALAAVRKIQAAPDSIRIGALADDLGVSLDRLEKRFRRAVGGSPKQFASLLQLRRALTSYRAGGSLAQLSLEGGYYDQAHFIRHFRKMAGVSPQRFLERERYC